MKVYKAINLNDCVLIKDYLKSLEKNHLVKKSKVLSKDELDRYLQLDESDESLLVKCCLVIGVHGLLRTSELVELKVEDVIEVDNYFSIFI